MPKPKSINESVPCAGLCESADLNAVPAMSQFVSCFKLSPHTRYDPDMWQGKHRWSIYNNGIVAGATEESIVVTPHQEKNFN